MKGTTDGVYQADVPTIPSRHKIDEVVLFQPNPAKIDARTGTTDMASATRAKVVGIRFCNGKVLYDLAVAEPEAKDGFYEVFPIRDVDSFFVLDDVKLKAVA